ncbi:MAG: DUF3093 domain-containing protein [Actinomycetota bacterium]|nr:DUF3093 domain-containing protein [Actinomycetota bacterium]
MSISADPGSRHHERLWVPVRWWLLLVVFLTGVALALMVSTPPVLAWPAAAVATLIGVALLLAYGAARVEVTPTALHAGRAALEWSCCGPATALDRESTRRLHGVDADPRAFLLMRPYLGTAVRVEVDDPADPTPYWLLSSRRPQRLAESVNRMRVLAD